MSEYISSITDGNSQPDFLVNRCLMKEERRDCLNYLSFILSEVSGASQVVLVVKNLPADAGDMRCGFDPWVGKIPWRRAWQPTAVFLPGESHGQRSWAGYHRVAKSGS